MATAPPSVLRWHTVKKKASLVLKRSVSFCSAHVNTEKHGQMDGGSLNGGTSTKLLIRELSVRILAICCSGTTAPLIKPPTRPTPAGRSRKTRCSAGTRLVDWERKSDEMKIRSAPPGFVGLSGRKTRQDRNATVSPQSRTKTSCCPNVRKQRLRRRQTQTQ